MTTAALVGSTGLVGSNILSHMLNNPSYSAVYAYTRRELPNPSASTKITVLSSKDTSTWPSMFPTAPTAPQVFFSGLGSTRASAGGLEAQRKIDLDLNLDLAKAAKAAGCDTYVLISTGGANSKSMAPYMKMKGELEDAVKELGFKHTVLLRPGLIVGSREESRPLEAILRSVAGGLGKLSPILKDSWAQDASVIAGAAVNAGLMCVQGKKEPGVWVVSQKEILELGKEKK